MFTLRDMRPLWPCSCPSWKRATAHGGSPSRARREVGTCLPEGPDALIRDGHVVEGAFYHSSGHEQGPIVDGQGRVGYLIAVGDSRRSLMRRAYDAFANLSIRNEDDEEMLFWPDEQLVRG